MILGAEKESEVEQAAELATCLAVAPPRRRARRMEWERTPPHSSPQGPQSPTLTPKEEPARPGTLELGETLTCMIDLTDSPLWVGMGVQRERKEDPTCRDQMGHQPKEEVAVEEHQERERATTHGKKPPMGPAQLSTSMERDVPAEKVAHVPVWIQLVGRFQEVEQQWRWRYPK